MLVAVLPTSVQESNFTDSILVLDFYQVESSQEYICAFIINSATIVMYFESNIWTIQNIYSR